jgi:DNA repair exonuclease SbcCD ATPase subunit
MAMSEAWRAKREEINKQIEEQDNKIAGIRAGIDGRAAEQLKSLVIHENNLKDRLCDIDRVIGDVSDDIASTMAKQSAIEEAKKEIQRIEANKDTVNTEISEWVYLRNACGKNGLQAMEIDGAAPIITGYANELLSQAFGSLYTVKFLTQDDNGKECLDIITITDDGEEVLLENLSGGQKVWVLMALRLAMTLLSKEKSGRNFQTAFFDEMDGALDSENAVNFISMYRAFMEIGQFETIPFISHKPECRSMADHVLMFEKGKNPYWM